ncbi:hypothetical protein ACLESO_28200 [Pyxidicoccus sp. 3LG]
MSEDSTALATVFPCTVTLLAAPTTKPASTVGRSVRRLKAKAAAVTFAGAAGFTTSSTSSVPARAFTTNRRREGAWYATISAAPSSKARPRYVPGTVSFVHPHMARTQASTHQDRCRSASRKNQVSE